MYVLCMNKRKKYFLTVAGWTDGLGKPRDNPQIQHWPYVTGRTHLKFLFLKPNSFLKKDSFTQILNAYT